MLEASCVCVLLLLFLWGLLLAAVAVSGGGGGDDKFVYSGFAGATNLTLHGAAMVTPGGLLQLTDGAAVSKGHAFHPTLLHLRGGGTRGLCSPPLRRSAGGGRPASPWQRRGG